MSDLVERMMMERVRREAMMRSAMDPSIAQAQQEGIDKANRSPFMAREMASHTGLPFVGEWMDELHGLIGKGSYDEARARFNSMVGEVEANDPKTLAALKAANTVVGSIAAAPVAVGGGATTIAGNIARGAIGGGVAGGLESAVSSAGAAGRGQRMDAAVDAAPDGAALGALFGAGANAVIGVGTKAFQKVFTASQKRPTVQSLKAAKQAAYKAVDDANEVFSSDELMNAVASFENKLGADGYVGGFGQKTDQVLARLQKLALKGEPVKLSVLDDVRSRLWKSYNAAPDEVEILDAIDVVDGLIAGRASTSELLEAARIANSRFRKAEMLDAAFVKAGDQTAASGSGGNILNKYRQAVVSIIDNPRKAKWFSDDEVTTMRAFVHGDVSENILRKVGKLSPNGNGLMQALNLMAVAVDPTMIAVSGAATAAKASADRSAMKGADAILDMVSGRPKPTVQSILSGGVPAGVYSSSSFE